MQPASVEHEASPTPSAPEGPTAARPPGPGTHRDQVAALYDEHAASLFHYLLAVLGNRAEAEDVLQAVFVEVVRREGLLAGIQSPRTYLLTVARRCAGRARKSSQRRRLVETAAGTARLLEARSPRPDDPQETARLEQAILSLPVEQREVLVLRIFEELTFPEIGLVLGVSENTAASRHRYALQKLRERLAGRLDR